MTKNNDIVILKHLNNDLKKYKVKLEFQYYDVCPFKESKIEILEVVLRYVDLYESIISRPMTQSAEPIIEMLSKFNIEKFEPIIFNLIKKENLIPKAWLGELNEDSKYWCSLVALKCIVNKKDNKYLDFFEELIDDQDMNWIKFTDSKYANKLTIDLKNKYKSLAKKGINKIK